MEWQVSVGQDRLVKEDHSCLPFTKFIFPKIQSDMESKEHNFLGHSTERFLGAMEHLKRYSPVFPDGIFQNGNSCSISSKPSLILVQAICGRFLVNGTDLYKW